MRVWSRSLGFVALLSLASVPAGAVGPDKAGIKPQSISLPSGPGSIEGLGESMQLQLNTGAATFAVPLAVPRAAGGHQPVLRLSYNSLAGNSPFGLGWDLPLPAIQRQTDKGQPTYTDADTFLCEGEELVELADHSFRAENETAFRRFRRLDSGGWEAREKDGTILRFGTTAASRESVPTGQPGAAVRSEFDRTFRWLLCESEDVNGNLILYSYGRREGSPGRKYLEWVRYNLRSADDVSGPHHAVQFLYEPRPDPLPDFRSGFEQRLGHRCTEARVMTCTNPGARPDGVVVRRYVLCYSPEHPEQATAWAATSRLHRVEQRDRDGTPLPPLRLEYSEFLAPLRARAQVVAGVPEVSPESIAETQVVDVNGDALPDLVHLRPRQHRVALNLGGGRLEGKWRDFCGTSPDIGLSTPGVQLFDVDGDGVPELVQQQRQDRSGPDGTTFRRLEISLGTDKEAACRRLVGWGTLDWFHTALPLPIGAATSRLLDVDFDKTIDVIQASPAGFVFCCNRAVRSEGRRTWSNESLVRYEDAGLKREDLPAGFGDADGDGARSDPLLFFLDMNGDRLSDLVRITRAGRHSIRLHVWPSKGQARFASPVALRIRDGDRVDEQVSYYDSAGLKARV